MSLSKTIVFIFIFFEAKKDKTGQKKL